MSGLPTPALVLRESSDGTIWWEAKWRSGGRQIKRRIADGPAWAERAGEDELSPRKGRAGAGYLNRDRAAVLAAQLVEKVEQERSVAAADAAAAADRAQVVTFRAVSQEWLEWLRSVKGCKPSTYRDYEALLRDPGHAFRRGAGTSPGRIQAAFGDRDVRSITTRDVSLWLRRLDAEGLMPRNVNKHRQVVASILGYACREDTYGLARNVAEGTDKRREPAPAVLDFYEPHEVEALASALSAGLHRTDAILTDGDERLARAADDSRDADFFRVLFFTGLRLAELRALRWAAVDLHGRSLLVRSNVSAGQEVAPKSNKVRFVPLTRQAVDVLARQRERADFVTDEDYVFASRTGTRLDDSALRRRYHAAREAAGLRRVKLHGLRHAAGSIHARHATAVEVRDFLGHSKLSTTDRYVSARISPEVLSRLDEAFDGRVVKPG